MGSNNKYEESPNSAKYRLIPIILMIGLVPLLVHMYQYNTNLSQFDWFPDSAEAAVDFFFAWKMYAIILVGGFIGLTLLYRHFIAEDKLRFEKPFVFLLIYLVLVLLAAIFSKHKYWVVHGTYELFEPVWVIVAYLLLCYYTYNYVREEKQVDYILGWSGIGMACLTLLGVFQYAGYDLFGTDFGKKLISDRSYWDNLDSITMNFAGHRSYATLYNPNFLSFYFGMLIPLLVCLLIGEKKVWHRILIVVAEVLCLVCLKGSGCTSGWLALVISGVILVLVLLSRRKKTWIAGISGVVVGMVVAIVVISSTSMGQFVRETIIGRYDLQDKYRLNSMKTNLDNVILDIEGNNLILTLETEKSGDVITNCMDANGKALSLKMISKDDGIFGMEDKRFKDIMVQPFLLDEENQIPCVIVTIDDLQWMFVSAGEEGYFFVNKAGKPVKCEPVETSHLFKTDAMSGRGHIWNNTIPLLKKHILLGSGANTFMFEYPQDDYIGQEYIYDNGYQVKAHCWYLQQWVENGFIGTMALMIFIGWYVVRSIRIYRCVDLHNRLTWIGFGLFSAVFVYLVTAFVNDSNVCTAPVFWGMLGLGLAVNRMLVEKEKLFVKTENEENRSQ